MPSRDLLPTPEERALQIAQRMSLGNGIKSSSPVARKAPQLGQRVPSAGIVLGSDADLILADTVTLLDGVGASFSATFSSPPSWIASNQIGSAGLYAISLRLNPAGFFAGGGFFAAYLTGFPPSALLVPSDGLSAIGEPFLLCVVALGASDVPQPLDVTYQMPSGANMDVTLYVQQLAS